MSMRGKQGTRQHGVNSVRVSPLAVCIPEFPMLGHGACSVNAWGFDPEAPEHAVQFVLFVLASKQCLLSVAQKMLCFVLSLPASFERALRKVPAVAPASTGGTNRIPCRLLGAQ